MDLEVQERTRAHYDRHAPADANSRQGMEERQNGLAFPLKQFHNEVKKQLLYRFARDKPRLLDLACGRGGDLHKWVGAGVRYVKGLDLSPNEIDEARRRYQELLTRKPNLGQRFRADFEPSDILGVRDWMDEPGAPKYDIVSCMFAIHYFFVTEAGLKQFFRNVSLNLNTGGYFVGTCPDGKQAGDDEGGSEELFGPFGMLLKAAAPRKDGLTAMLLEYNR
ncbi:hypothetical protein WJX84_002918 [Apatococcus fuscideae]|uniref:mRNA (guanine-N(7))-methyltransferase n=1 Tax=Apatococcus fuscideae TaxID=2026836 RepID=A0AAW1SMX3_9CHLO